ncbi:MAG TPA: class I SAM-dependent methyltransferase [Stellaceae bacterium]|jgi:SAM-dependent methyltransferase|nr:class I SAM-dependent methyltransferase [Stellaceae bacterium]
MTDKTHEALVETQFGARADAYLTSAVHSQGPDLDALAALVAGQAQARALDLGSGGGHVSFAVAPHVREIVAYDLSAEMLAVVARAARERGFANLVTQQGVAEALPFDDASFDFVFSRYSAHHWRDFERGVAEAARVLKPGGTAGFVDTVAPPSALLDTFLQAVELLRDPSHVRDHSCAQWLAAIGRAGLVAGAASEHRLRLDIVSWLERMRTPPLQADAIRALQAAMSDSVRHYFAIEADGSFTIDVLTLVAAKPA